MTDPITLATATGVASGLATFWSLEASNWVKSFFTDHHPKAIEKAQENTSNFLIELHNRIQKLETQDVNPNQVLEDPDFSAAFQKAVLASAQTENKEKQKVLAEILAQRLTVEAESLLALTTKMALDVISFLTPNQLNILGLIVSLYNLSLIHTVSSEEYALWLREIFKPYLNVTINELDLMHLESLSCLTINHMVGRDFVQFLASKNNNTPPSSAFLEMKYGISIKSLWDGKLENVDLSSVGLLIGMNINCLRKNTPFPKNFFI